MEDKLRAVGKDGSGLDESIIKTKTVQDVSQERNGV